MWEVVFVPYLDPDITLGSYLPTVGVLISRFKRLFHHDEMPPPVEEAGIGGNKKQ